MDAAPPVVESARTALEEAFFRRGHEVAQAAVIEPDFLVEEVTTSRHAQPRAVARRAQLRRVFAGVMGFASVLTVVVTAKALARQADGAAPMDTALTVRHAIVPSINLDRLAVEPGTR